MNTGQIVKAKRKVPFTQIPNDVLKDPELSLKAKGLLCHLLSLPEDWVIYVKELTKHHSDGRDGVRSAFKELQENGYIMSVEIRNENGHFKGYNHMVYDTPYNGEPKTGLPNTENPKSVYPKSENPTLQINTITNTNQTNKEDIYPFELFWDEYDRKVGRPKAEKLYNKLSVAEKKNIFSHLKKYIPATPDKKYRKHPETYLRNRSWQDEVLEEETKKGSVRDPFANIAS